ncbi:Cytochrome P450 78A3 [Tolypocladium paradoxum]|uniref:Cytochrome P450 78A3 n=1 Tax=Tolypocladium paradoxum TaxID=94208 RepID=A0A2S4L1H4_9HYPO|nr:Cytochrome P450 78A3 [Tolypocladium paradoxum]
MRRLSWQFMAGSSIIGCALPKLLHRHWSTAQLAELFFAQLFMWAVWSTLIYPHFVSPLRHLPQPKGGHWLAGHGLESWRQGPGVLAKKWYLITEVDNKGLIRMLWHFNREFVLVTSPHALSDVLVTKSYIFEKPDFIRNFLAFALGWSVLTVEGDEHKKQRRNLMPAFSFRHIKDLYPVFWDKAREVTRAMTSACDEHGFAEMEISSWASRCTLDIIGVAGIGKDFGAIRDEHNPLVKSYEGFNPSEDDSLLVGLRVFLPELVVANLPLKRIKMVAESSQHIRSVCADLIREKRRKLANKEPAGVDILTVALTSGMFSEESLVDQMITFLSAGHDTTASALTWAVYMLSRFPRIQDRLRDEVRENLPSINVDAQITSTDIDRMPYLNAVCSEVLRTCGPVAQTMRVATCDTSIQDEYIPRGTVIILAPWATNVDPKLWGPDAREFKPERWLTPEQGGTSSSKNAASGGATSNYAFMTFLHGPRSCIGASFAKAEFACLLAAWVGRFSFELKDKTLMDERNMRVAPSVTAKPVGGLHVLVRVVEGF